MVARRSTPVRGVESNSFIPSESPLYYLARNPVSGAPQVVGTVVAFTPSGFVTLRAMGELASEGSAVRDARGVLEGRVVRVFGPVARPYLLVRPRRAPSPVDGASLLGSEVYRA